MFLARFASTFFSPNASKKFQLFLEYTSESFNKTEHSVVNDNFTMQN